MDKALTETAPPCAYCGHAIAGDLGAPARFGEHFCSEEHAEEFVARVRAARIEAAANLGGNRSEDQGGRSVAPGQQSWRDALKRSACWAAPVLLLLAVPLFWSGGWGAAGGSILSAIAFLACPLGMYFMMRGMKSMPGQGGGEAERERPHEGHSHV
jgi:hypothetical protein